MLKRLLVRPGKPRADYPTGNDFVIGASIVIALSSLRFFLDPAATAQTPVGQLLDSGWDEAYRGVLLAGGLLTSLAIAAGFRIVEEFGCILIAGGTLIQGIAVEQQRATSGSLTSGIFAVICVIYLLRAYRLHRHILAELKRTHR